MSLVFDYLQTQIEKLRQLISNEKKIQSARQPVRRRVSRRINREDCFSDVDFLTTDELDFAKQDIITIRMKGKRKGECFSRESLVEMWKMLQGKFFIWEDTDDTTEYTTEHTTIKRERAYKLPTSGIWITQRTKKLIERTPRKIFELRPYKEVYVGQTNDDAELVKVYTV